MKQQQNLSSFFTLKRMAGEPDKYEDGLDRDGNEAGEVSLISQWNAILVKAVQQSQFSTELNFYCKSIKKNTKL